MVSKNYVFLFSILLTLVGPRVNAHDIKVENADGIWIYYNIINEGKELEVTSNGNYTNDYRVDYKGIVVIPEEVIYANKKWKVTSIGESAFAPFVSSTGLVPSSLTSVTIPNSVTNIGGGAFWGCKNLSSINIPNSVSSIGDGAFMNCISLTSINIPNNLSSIGEWVFTGCSGLTSITIPNNVSSIGECAFQGCSSLAFVTIPPSVTYIGNNAFFGCSGLTSVHISDLEAWCRIAFCEVSSNPLYYAHHLFLNGKELNKLAIPNSVTSIGSSAFCGCSGLTSVTIPDNVTSIGGDAFYGCSSLISITIPNSVTYIGDGAFRKCSGLKDVISEIKTPFEIDEWVFSSDSYTSATLTVTKGTKSAYQSTNYWNKFSNIVENSDDTNKKRTIHVSTAGTLPDLIQESERYTIEELTLTGELNGTDLGFLRYMAGGGSYDKSGNYVKWSSSKLEILDISKVIFVEGGVYYNDFDKEKFEKDNHGDVPYVLSNPFDFPKYLFYNCKNLRKVMIPESVTSIGDYAFYNCNGLTLITIPNSMTSIGPSAFRKCSGLTSITIPNSVTNIGGWAFCDCSGLTSITIPNSVTSIGPSVFRRCSTLTSITIPNSVKNIGDGAFRECSSLTSITIPNSVMSIGVAAFYDCSSLTSIEIPKTVTSIGIAAFRNCSGLTTVTIPNSVTSIDKDVFYGCSSLSSVNIPNSVTIIGNSSFYKCSGLPSITIPNSVTSIGDDVFAFCSGLTSITIPNSVTSIGDCAFENCSSLTSIAIPNSVTSIGYCAFRSCSGLKSIIVESGNVVYDSRGNCNAIIRTDDNELIVGCKNTIIPNSVMSIGNYAFSECSGLMSITIPNSVKSIGDWAFYFCSGLTSITIPSSVKSIGNYAFFDCFAIRSIISEIISPFEISEIVFSVYAYATLIVPKGTMSAYQSTNYWNKFSNIVENSDNNTKKRTIHVETAGTLSKLIGSEKYDIEELTLTGELNGLDLQLLRAMAGGGFYDKSGYYSKWDIGKLEVLDISKVTLVEGGVYYYDIDKEQFERTGYYDVPIVFSNPLEIPTYLFYDCENLQRIMLPESVTSIQGQAFYNCSNLTSITIPNSVTNIGSDAFYATGWYNNQSDGVLYLDKWLIGFKGDKPSGILNIAEGINRIADGAFRYCTDLTSLTIPNSIVSIGNYAFQNCIGLTSIAIGNSVTSIGKFAFYGPTPTRVVSLIENPFNIYGELSNNKTFTQEAFNQTMLYVPVGTLDKYKSTEGWKDFKNIKEGTPSSINQICVDAIVIQSNGCVLSISGAQEGSEIIIYNLAGQKVGSAKASSERTDIQTSLSNGEIGIVKIDNKSLKVMIK